MTDSVLSGEDADLLSARKRVGSTLNDKWRLVRLIGVGGMAAVYEAHHRNGKRAAVKILHPECAANDSLRARFLKEGYVANRISHPAIVSVLDDDTTPDGAAFLVMELLEGESLEDRRLAAGGRMPVLEVIDTLDQVLDALAVAHAAGIIHRDLKPENLFRTTDGRVKILDFGIARAKELGAPATSTRTGSTMGTPVFMPPEQAAARWSEVDARTDLWALGATAFSLLSGQYVHDGDTPMVVLVRAVTTPPRRLVEVASWVDPAMCAVIDKALAFDKNDRFPDALEMKAALAKAKTAVSAAPPAGAIVSPAGRGPALRTGDANAASDAIAAPAPSQPATSSKKTPIVAALALVAVAGAAAGAWFAFGGSKQPDAPKTPATVVASAEPHPSASHKTALVAAPSTPVATGMSASPPAAPVSASASAPPSGAPAIEATIPLPTVHPGLPALPGVPPGTRIPGPISTPL